MESTVTKKSHNRKMYTYGAGASRSMFLCCERGIASGCEWIDILIVESRRSWCAATW
jgi:hypothetical protein